MGLESSLAGRPVHFHWPLFITGLIVRREPGAYRGQSCSQSSSEFKKLLQRKCYSGEVQSLLFFDQKWLKSYLKSLVRGQSLQSNCWYARDVTAVVGGKKQKHFCSLGTKLCFHVNSSSKNYIVLTPNMAALSRDRKPIVKFRTFGSVNDQMPCASPISSSFFSDSQNHAALN